MKVNAISPLDSDYRSGLQRIEKKHVIIFLIFLIAFGYGLSLSVGNEVVKLKIYNQNMDEIKSLVFHMNPNQTITRMYYINNVSPIPVNVIIESNNKWIELNYIIEKTILFENDMKFLQIEMINTANRDVSFTLYIEGVYNE